MGGAPNESATPSMRGVSQRTESGRRRPDRRAQELHLRSRPLTDHRAAADSPSLHRKSSYLKRRGVASSTSWFSRVPSRVLALGVVVPATSQPASVREATPTERRKRKRDGIEHRTRLVVSPSPRVRCLFPGMFYNKLYLLTYLRDGRIEQ